MAAASASPASHAASPPRDDALERLASFGRQQAHSSREVTPAREAAFRELLEAARQIVVQQPARDSELIAALTYTAGTGVDPPDLVAQAALEALEQALVLDRKGPVLVQLVEHLADREPERRRGAVRALAPRRPAAALPGLLDAVRAQDDRLRSAALGALVGWPSPRVHTFFLEALDSNYPPLAQLDRHLAFVEQPLDAESQRRLATALLRLTSANGWRGAARANRLVRHLEPKFAVPFLLEALRLWVERERDGRGSRRIRQELVDHLRRISGRSLGTTPGDWTGWWRCVCDGSIPLAVDMPEEQLSTASFFGLRPISDRVVFVLDRSGSMEDPFHADGDRKSAAWSRYDEAVEQVFRYLTSAGPQTRFGLVVFSDEAADWERQLQAATPDTIARARRWLERREPAGGTNLRPGIDLACQVERDGSIDLEELEADTIVVLCDGATAEGPAWVDPWLTRHAAAELVFHGVLIQTAGDGTLRALAEGTGGDFIVVGR